MTSSQERTLAERVLKDGDVISFDATDSKAPTPGSSLGTAEFSFCPQWHRGKIKAVHICPLQQRDQTERWRIDSGYATGFSVQSWTNRGVDIPRPWIWFWCKEHRCMGMRVYVPRNSSQFLVRTGSDVSIYFDHAGVTR